MRSSVEGSTTAVLPGTRGGVHSPPMNGLSRRPRVARCSTGDAAMTSASATAAISFIACSRLDLDNIGPEPGLKGFDRVRQVSMTLGMGRDRGGARVADQRHKLGRECGAALQVGLA